MREVRFIGELKAKSGDKVVIPVGVTATIVIESDEHYIITDNNHQCWHVPKDICEVIENG